MNVTELARKIKITTNELKELLPQLGFDIGRKAIKVDEVVAQRIIEAVQSDPGIISRFRSAVPAAAEAAPAAAPATPVEKKKLSIPSVITVRDFATMVNRPVATIIQELMKNGILATLNERIDYETASIIAQDFGLATAPQDETQEAGTTTASVNDLTTEDDPAGLAPRPPIVVVMGHVDHGKTMLLDTIRKANVAGGESGGITQHIGAYQVTVPTKEEQASRARAGERGIPRQARDDHAGRVITFIDTPGHQAFTAIRSRGARVADIAILVIAAEDGIKPQTEEAIQIIQSAKIPFIVAMNKIDKPEAQPEKIKQQLAQRNLLPEDWGGSIICVPVSAKSGAGVESLLESVLLVADVEKDHIRANPDRPAIGTVIEAHIDKGEGGVATIIIQAGTLRRGDLVQVGQIAGKVRAMKDFKGIDISTVPPSMPARIIGLGDVPQVGDILTVSSTDQSLKQIKKQLQHQHKVYRDQQTWRSTQTKQDDKKEKKKSVNIILKTDTLGSQEAIVQSLETLGTPNVTVTIVRRGLGNVSDVDLLHAESGQALICGFNVKVEPRAAEQAKEKGINIKRYTVIYDLIDDITKEVERYATYATEIVEVGRAKVLAVFRTDKSGMILGGQVTKGKLETGGKAKVVKASGESGGQVTIVQLQQGKQSVPAVPAGTECGLQIKGSASIEKGDFLEAFREEVKKIA